MNKYELIFIVKPDIEESLVKGVNDSIKAVLNPETSNYYYFVADKNGNTYFTKTYQEHTAKVRELKEKGLWYEYEN